MKVIDGKLSAAGLRVGIALARFNGFFGEALLEGALDALRRSGADDKDITVVKVPGAWELPVVAKKLAETKKLDAIIALGVVIRGHTPHFEYVAGESAKGLATVTMQTGLPVINGIITTDTLEQAMERAGSKAGNKGYDAAITAIEMASVLSQIG